MECPICSGEIQDNLKLCPDHRLALKNMVRAYNEWDKAYGGISKQDYLERILNRKETGKFALEVAKFLLDDSDNLILWKDIVSGD